MSPSEFIEIAYAAVRALRDSACGAQMHRRAVQGRKLAPFVHATGRVTARLEGQYIDMEPPVPGAIYERPQRGGARPAIRDDDARIRGGGRKEPVNARMSPTALKLAKAHAAKAGESLGEYLERLVFSDLGNKMPPPSAG